MDTVGASTRRLPHRFFWTWDHSMDWDPRGLGRQVYGASNPYYKPPDSFLEDYCRAVDFCSAQGYTGVIVYGFLRDSHGGIESAQELCRYGAQRGVRIIPGIGVNSYAGIYWEGEHEFNLPTWLDKHPELEAVSERSARKRCLRMACPSRPENLEWHKRAVTWLAETFEIGGINFETGDYGICKCDLCRRASGRDGYFSAHDMAHLLPPLVEAAAEARPGLLCICECYFDNVLDAEQTAPLCDLPDDVILQFCINREFWPRLKEEISPEAIARLPPHEKVLRTHMGTQWNRERDVLVARTFIELARIAAANGLDGVTVFGEAPAQSAVNEINYLGLVRACDNPALSWEGFVSEHLGPLLGGPELATEFVYLLEAEGSACGALARAKDALKRVDEPAYGRWLWLVQQLRNRRAQATSDT